MKSEVDTRYMDILIKNQSNRSVLFGDHSDLQTKQIKSKQQSNRSLFWEGFASNTAIVVDLKKSPSSDTQVNSAKISISRTDKTAEKSFLVAHSKKKKKKKDKKNRKRREHICQEVSNCISDNLIDSDNRNGNLMAELMKHSNEILLVDDSLWLYDSVQGCFKPCAKKDIATKLRSLLDYSEQLKISTREYQEAYEQLLISEELICEDGFLENQPLVNCLNGVVDVVNGDLLEHSPDYKFKHCVLANYDPKARCDKFLEYLDFITNKDEELKLLMRVMLSYLFSSYNNAKKAFILISGPGRGKSVLCNLIRRIIGKDFVSGVDLSMLCKQEYAASLFGKLVNICPDLKNIPLTDVGFFKSLVSHDDLISTRALYSNPKEFKCDSKMVFASNHYLTFGSDVSPSDVDAVFTRLIYYPYQNGFVKEEQQDKHLSEKLYSEKDGIFTWAIQGLRYYIDNNENFPKSKLSENVKLQNMAAYCPEKVFFEKCIKRKDDTYESSLAIRAAFDSFCRTTGVKTKGNILNYLDNHEHLKKCRKRVDGEGKISSKGNAIYVYENIALKKRYRSSVNTEGRDYSEE